MKNKKKYWLYLLCAIVLEVAGTSVMKVSQQSSPLVGMLSMYTLLALSYFCLAKSTVVLPIGVAYACWEGIGIILITLSSIFIIGEQLTSAQLFALLLILCGTILINKGTEPNAKERIK